MVNAHSMQVASQKLTRTGSSLLIHPVNQAFHDRILALDSSWLQRAPTLLAVVLGSFFFSTTVAGMTGVGTGVDVVVVGVGVRVGATGGAGLLLEKISSPYLAISSAWLKTALLFGDDLFQEAISCSMDISLIGKSHDSMGVTKRVCLRLRDLCTPCQAEQGSNSRITIHQSLGLTLLATPVKIPVSVKAPSSNASNPVRLFFV